MSVKERLEEVLKGTSFEDYSTNCEDFDNAEETIEYLQERITEEEIIYYSNAIKYLQENDASLRQSLDIASELCYTAKSLNSELLATLLLQQNMQEELSNLTSDIEDIFEEE